MSALSKPGVDVGAVLLQGPAQQPKEGLTQQERAAIVGVNRSAISRWSDSGGLRPESKTGELALLLIRAYRALFALFGGTVGHATFPAHREPPSGRRALQQMGQVQGLVRVVEYLDAIRGKV